MVNAQKYLLSFLDKIDVSIGGDNVWDIVVCNNSFYKRVIHDKAIGFGESYVDGWWDCLALDQLFYKIFSSKVDDFLYHGVSNTLTYLPFLFQKIQKKIFFDVVVNKKNFLFNGKIDDDLEENFFRILFGDTMSDLPALWRNAICLQDAQYSLFDMICRKLDFQPGKKVLNIGCGWGAFAQFAAKNYGVSIIGITKSFNQKRYADSLNKGFSMNICVQDYLSINESFDCIVSFATLENMNIHDYPLYRDMIFRCLKTDGLFLSHIIVTTCDHFSYDPWVKKYMLCDSSSWPTLSQVITLFEKKFILEHLYSLTFDYEKTLLAWHKNINTCSTVEKKYGIRLKRMWDYYLLFFAGAVRARKLQVWQIICSKNTLLIK